MRPSPALPESSRFTNFVIVDRFGLIGCPIADSKSPALFGAGYGGAYAYDLLEGGDFQALWRRFLDGYKAVNVTAPFKLDAYREAVGAALAGKGGVSGPCAKIGATNLVVKGADGFLNAYNTDFSGIILSVAEAYFPGVVRQCYSLYGERGHVKVHQFVRESLPGLFRERPQALVVGCGGAGRAAAVAAAEMGFGTALMNRSPHKASQIAESLPEYGFVCVPIEDFRGAVRECDLVIYTLPCKVEGVDALTAGDFAGEDRYASSNPAKVILEANYKSPAFSGAVRERLSGAGCQYVHGTQWLLYQALAGYGLMTGVMPDLAAMAGTFREMD